MYFFTTEREVERETTMSMYTPTPIVDTDKVARQTRQYLLLTELQGMSRQIPL